MQRIAGFGLDAYDLRRAVAPGGDAADQPAAAHRHQDGVEVRRLLLELEPDRALSVDRLRRVIGMDRERSGFVCEFGRLRQGIGIGPAPDHHLGAIALDAGKLCRRRAARHEDVGRNTYLLRRIGDRGAVIAARCRHNACIRYVHTGQVCKRATRLKGARVLQAFELHRDGDANTGNDNFDHRRDPDRRSDATVGFGDAGAANPRRCDGFGRLSLHRSVQLHSPAAVNLHRRSPGSAATAWPRTHREGRPPDRGHSGLR